MSSLGPIRSQKYLRQGYSFTAGAERAALSDLLLLSASAAHTNMLPHGDPPIQRQSALPIGLEAWLAPELHTLFFFFSSKGRFCVSLEQMGVNNR